MSASIEYENEGAGVLIKCSGHVHSDELVAAHQHVFERSDMQAPRYQIIDLNDVDSLNISVDRLQFLAAQLRVQIKRLPDLQVAFVSNHDLVQSIVHIWCVFIHEGKEAVQQFNELDQAREWVKGLSLQPSEPA